MEPSKRAAEILAIARQGAGPIGWLGRLPENDRNVLIELRNRWQESRGSMGISAAQLARQIMAQMPGNTYPSVKELAAWLNRESVPPKS